MRRRAGGTAFPIPREFTRGFFRRCARALRLVINGDVEASAVPKEFATGSLGWTLSRKFRVTVPGPDGTQLTVWVQGTCNFTVIGSAQLPVEQKGVNV